MAQTETRIFHYDLLGHIIAETNQSGQMLAEYVYLGDQLLAMIRPGETAYYYHSDHLGTPQVLTDETQTVAWKAGYTPFGEAVISISTVENPFRFPGQYYDQETGLHYNDFRYYDPTTGRYVTPDPIGLEGGINLWPYVGNNPMSWVDRWGLAPPQNIPPGVNIRQNINEAQNMSWINFYKAVRTGGKWDYKLCGRQYEEFGNYHFGIVGTANGFTEGILLRSAGAYQIYSDLLQYGTKNYPGWPWGNSPYGDQPQDQRWIREGVQDYNNLYKRWRGASGSW